MEYTSQLRESLVILTRLFVLMQLHPSLALMFYLSRRQTPGWPLCQPLKEAIQVQSPTMLFSLDFQGWHRLDTS
uniref:Uncharacterized protein n=1 Tax=Arundo donax TaxID=35708 RepID=A0A0A9TNX0_ARUDO